MTGSAGSAALQALLARLDGVAGVAWAFHPALDRLDLLDPSEARAVARAVPARRAEFVAGRLAARAALARLGVAVVPLPQGAGRAPVWPEGIVGSISHSGAIAVAVVGRAASWAGLGIDLEARSPEAEQSAALILEPDEAGRDALAVFSAKEAGFKAQFPATGVWLDYAAARLAVDGASLAFTRSRTAAALPPDWAQRRLPVLGADAGGWRLSLCAVPFEPVRKKGKTMP